MSGIAVGLACLLVSFIWNILFWDKPCGISVPIFTAITISFFLWFKRKTLPKSKITLLVHILLLEYLAICACCFRNDLILYATIPAVFIGLAALPFIGMKGYSFLNFAGVIESLAKTTALTLPTAPKAIVAAFNKFNFSGKSSSTTKKVLLGILISIPFLILFTSLFTSADPIFKKYLQDFFDFLWHPDIILRGAVIFLMWYFFCGYLASSAKNETIGSFLDRTKSKQNEHGTIVFVFLLMLNLLFLCFIIIQLDYLFGGGQIIKNSDFTFASYTHKGFYEFWATVILVSLIIICTDFILSKQSGRIRRMVVCTWIAMIGQTLVIIASGLKRISAYEQAYGYTYLRILVALFYLWIAGVFILFIVKIIRKKKLSWLISTGTCLAFIFLIFVSTFSIDKYIAGNNIDRHLSEGRKIDMEYLSTLSTDAYHQIQRLETEAENKHIQKSAGDILLQMQEEAENKLKNWQSWNKSLAKTKK